MLISKVRVAPSNNTENEHPLDDSLAVDIPPPEVSPLDDIPTNDNPTNDGELHDRMLGDCFPSGEQIAGERDGFIREEEVSKPRRNKKDKDETGKTINLENEDDVRAIFSGVLKELVERAFYIKKNNGDKVLEESWEEANAFEKKREKFIDALAAKKIANKC